MTKLFPAFVLFVFLSLYGQTANAQTNGWRPVSGSRQANISGMALVEHDALKTVFLIVNDNKKKEQNHAALLMIEERAAPKYAPLRWIGSDVPTDLEAVSSVPGSKNNFMAFPAAGRIYSIELDRAGNSVKLIKSFDAPQIPAGGDFEGFCLQKGGGALLAVWADRGLDAKPAQLFWAKFDLQNYSFGELNSVLLKVPFPAANTRHVSDLKVDETGAVFIASASDPGNDGPFQSAIYFAGTFNLSGTGKIAFSPSPALTRLFTFDYHKVEAIEFVPGASGGMVFGTDDENLGAAIYLDW